MFSGSYTLQEEKVVKNLDMKLYAMERDCLPEHAVTE